MRYGVCVPPEQIGVAAAAGFDFCELPARAVLPLASDADAAASLSAIAAAPLRPESFNSLIPPELPLCGPAVDRDALRVYLARAFGRMAALGASVAVLGSGGARRIPEGYPRDLALDQLADALGLAGDLAARAGVALAIEPLNRGECNVFCTLAETRGFIAARGLRGLSLLADLYHIEVEREPLSEVVAAGPLIVHVHTAGGGRRSPAVPGYNYSGLLAALAQIGYDARVSAECSWTDLAAEAPAALAAMMRG